jgi:hypothetical protein
MRPLRDAVGILVVAVPPVNWRAIFGRPFRDSALASRYAGLETISKVAIAWRPNTSRRGGIP